MSGRVRGRLAWAAVTAVAVVGSGGAVALAGPRVEAAPRAAAPACAEVASDVAAAAALAVRCDTEVEVVDARTEWATTFALSDGSMRLDISTGAVRTDVSGEWAAVSATLEDTGAAVTVASPVTPMRFSDGSGDEPFATIERDGHTLTFEMPFELPAPDVDGSQLIYADVLPGVDLVVTVNEDATGFSEVLRVESPEAAAHPDLADLTFPVTTSDSIEVQAQDGGFVAAEADGAPVFTSPVPVMWDSSSDVAEGTTDRALGTLEDADPTVAPVGDETVAEIPAEVAPDAVTVTPDAGMLADPGTEWPVYIDPGVSGSLNQRSAVRTVVGNAYNFAGDEGVGLCSRATSTTCSHTFYSRVLYQFVGLDAVGAVEPGDVRGATFSVAGTHSYDCTPRPVTLHAVADFTSGTPYPGGSYWKPLQTHTIAHRNGCTNGQVPRRIEFDATVAAQDIAAANQGHGSFGIAVDESSMAYWKRYGWDAGLSVTYNRAPSAPSAMGLVGADGCVVGADRPVTRDRRPVLKAVFSDPDGGNVHGNVALVSAVNPAVVVWDPAPNPAQGSGALQSVQVPMDLNDGGLYRWIAHGIDGDGRVGPDGVCEFAVDYTPPAMPVVTAIAGRDVVYAEDATAGGLGQGGLFRVSSGGSTDDLQYRYAFNSTDLNGSVPATTPVITFTPTQVGPQVLNVVAQDRAGNLGPMRTYRFTVELAALGSAWRLDETTAGTAKDVATGSANNLTVSPSTTVVNGLLAERGIELTDRALRFDSPLDTATSARPVVAGGGAFSVSALVRLDAITGSATVVSQDGTRVSGFELGHRTDPACPPATGGHCWTFAMRGADADSAAPVVVRSAQPLTAGAWAQITGVRGGDGQLRLYVCDLSTPDVTRSLVVREATPTAAPRPWLAAGPLQLGHGREAGAAARHLTGAIGDVRTYTGEVSLAQLRASCQSPGTMPAGPTNPPSPTRRNAGGNDFDGDGRADVFWSSMQDGWWRVSYGGVAPWAAVNYAGAIPTSSYQFGDLDGDGRDDVFLVWNNSWLMSSGGTTGWQRLGGDPNAGTNITLGDFDGDGKDDVFWAWAHDGNWRISYDRGATDWKIVNNAGPYGTEQFRIADFNGDGKDDVFMVDPHNGAWMVSDSGTTAWRAINAGGGVPIAQLKLGDLNGDGKADVFYADPADGHGRVSYGGTTSWQIFDNGGALRTDAFQLADMDGDGKDDVFLSHPNGEWWVSSGSTTGWKRINSAGEATGQVRVR
ncbi:FG-GAP-like repeat-containing protein [Cellulomonas shaoxiangyii]|uniref:LamG-like jellyroll fold domain-containing protein n=1 Tax=Cellulomonas shaoxiangyii TaxID=2566013 RepID=A0A4P7SPR4_9CELL|nr:FG-GAP-like repeat-containing protein [Cellulomonas shaoxiangyii]QCB94994.1 hypothetical protein E5225_16915 [Cellulomonas shaoxiangyii]TGY85281.1 hypothetical protein E5226_07280 [Cellulomonas shaoxiangyii]